jgi:hypothetical protein
MAEYAVPAHRFDAVLIGNDVSRGATAVAHVGGATVARLQWGEGLCMVGRPVLLVEAEGVDEQMIADSLPDIARFAVERGCKVVAAFDRSELEVVAASLITIKGVELLCEPDLPQRIEALLRAASPDPEPDATVREDAARERPLSYDAEASAEEEPRPQELRRAIRARRMRDGFFMPGLFADPAWDMLLDLYAAELEEQPVSVSSLCIAAAVAPTTALRWIARMTEDGLLERQPDQSDRRRAFMTLSEVARVGMRAYLLALKRAGLLIA